MDQLKCLRPSVWTTYNAPEDKNSSLDIPVVKKELRVIFKNHLNTKKFSVGYDHVLEGAEQRVKRLGQCFVFTILGTGYAAIFTKTKGDIQEEYSVLYRCWSGEITRPIVYLRQQTDIRLHTMYSKSRQSLIARTCSEALAYFSEILSALLLAEKTVKRFKAFSKLWIQYTYAPKQLFAETELGCKKRKRLNME